MPEPRHTNGTQRRGTELLLIGLLKVIVAALAGVGLGLSATWLALERGVAFGELRLGAWTTSPRAAYADADPYTRAHRARTGEAPLSQAEGLAFVAARDDAGAPLDPRCDYLLSSPTPAARLWTLTTLTPDGRPIVTEGRLNSITSAEIVRDSEGEFEVIASVHTRAGNWLPLTRGAPFVFLLRLYDTSGSAAAGVMSAAQMPSLRRGRCP